MEKFNLCYFMIMLLFAKVQAFASFMTCTAYKINERVTLFNICCLSFAGEQINFSAKIMDRDILNPANLCVDHLQKLDSSLKKNWLLFVLPIFCSFNAAIKTTTYSDYFNTEKVALPGSQYSYNGMPGLTFKRLFKLAYYASE